MGKRQKATTTQGIQHQTVTVDALAAHPRNYRRHPDAQIGRLAASLARFGQVRSIVVQVGAPGRYLVVAGHGIVEAARRLDLATLRADVIPADWTPEQVEGYLIADNQHAAGADDDMAELAALLQAQADAGYDLDALGSSDEELAALADGLARGMLDGADNENANEGEPPVFKEFDETVEDDLPTEMCAQCGKLCLKAGRTP